MTGSGTGALVCAQAVRRTISPASSFGSRSATASPAQTRLTITETALPRLQSVPLHERAHGVHVHVEAVLGPQLGERLHVGRSVVRYQRRDLLEVLLEARRRDDL